MKAHKIIDALRKVKGAPALMPDLGVPFDDVHEVYAQLIERAHKFQFTSIFFEREGDLWKFPSLTKDEFEFWTEGLLPLPFDLNWYEFETQGEGTKCLLIYELNNELNVRRFDIALLDGVETVSTNYAKFVLKRSDPQHVMVLFDGNDLQQHTARHLWGNIDKATQGKAIDNLAVPCINLSLYGTLMINSRTATRIKVEAPAKLNKKRIANGKTPFFNHVVVELINKTMLGQDGDGSHGSPKLHWRRSHLRHFENQTAESKWAANRVYKDVKGWHVVLIARQQVGRADLGELSHEYKVA